MAALSLIRSEPAPQADPPGRAHGGPDPFTSMAPRFGWLAGRFAKRFFGEFRFEPGDAERIQQLESRSAVIYVMRYSSRLDYFLFNWLFLSAGVRLSEFANGIRFYYYRPVGEALRLVFRLAVLRLRRGLRERELRHTRALVRRGGSAFIFLRTDKLGSRVRSRRSAVASARRETDYLREVIQLTFGEDCPVALVPLALFWRKGARQQRRFLDVFYGAPERPTDTAKVLSFLWNYRNLAVRVGTSIDLRRFVDERRAEGPERILKQVRRSLLIFLRREEKPVLGAALRPAERTSNAVLNDASVRQTIAEVATAEQRSQARVEARARRLLREIAARPSSIVLAILDVVVGWIFARLFARVDVQGLDRVVAAAKLRPLILVPSHRSHFDYLILSWLFYEKHLAPPLVAAGINLAFWPLGPTFRRAGAFFLRRSFDGDPLYSAVFRGYVQLMIKDGATQEFFIEGTRSRTGKTLQPRLGMLSMVLDAFSHGVRRDVCIIPVGFTYERLVEEGSMSEERRGSAKRNESLLGLLRARRVLRHRFGAATVCFGEPLSLSEAWGAGERQGEPGGRAERLRRVTESLGEEVCRCINGLIIAGPTSVSAVALLGTSARGVRETEFRARVEEISALLEVAGWRRSEDLERHLAEGRAEAAVGLLLQSGLVKRRLSGLRGGRGAILEFEEGVRDVLSYYRMTISPALVWPAVLAMALRSGARLRDPALDEASSWLDLLRLEYFPPPDPDRRALLSQFLDHMTARGWLEDQGEGRLCPSETGRAWLAFLSAQLRPMLETYGALFRTASYLDAPLSSKHLLDQARRSLEDDLLVGEALYRESICPTTFQNALALLLREGVLSCDGNPRSPSALLASGPNRALLAGFSARLAAALPSG